jgi:PAT family beta-lactamase induction signal transducer AmpG
VAFLSLLVNRSHTATQYALLSSLVNLPGKLLGFLRWRHCTTMGYGGFFVLTALFILPAMALYAALWPRFPEDAARTG